VTGIGRHRTYAIDIECLSVKDVIGKSFLQQLDEVFGRTATHKTGFDARVLHHLPEIADES
jgi:hypothetical protein